MSQASSGTDTHRRLLAAAGEVFAEVGYRAATLREICRRGEANIAAVNYHFRDKEHLYEAVVREAMAEAGEELALLAPDPNESPERQFCRFVGDFMRVLLGADRPVRLLQIFAHEMVEPSPALALVLDTAARPCNEILSRIVAELLGPGAEATLVRDCVGSVLSQCSSYYHSEAAIRHLDHLDVHDPATIERLAEHVCRFSLGGIRALAQGARAEGRRGGTQQGDHPKKVRLP
jgi:AcrR family transcriptional regulator